MSKYDVSLVRRTPRAAQRRKSRLARRGWATLGMLLLAGAITATARGFDIEPDEPAEPPAIAVQAPSIGAPTSGRIRLATSTSPTNGGAFAGAAAGYGGQIVLDKPGGPALMPMSPETTVSDNALLTDPTTGQSPLGQAAPCLACPQCLTADDLFLNYYDPFSTQFTYGTAGVQPYQYGWYSYNDFVYIPTSPAIGVPGQMQIFEWNSWVRYSRRIGDRLIFSWTPEFNGEFWRPPASLGLPTFVNEFKSDFKLASVNAGKWNWQIGFTPQLNADLKRSLNADAYLFDGRAVVLYRVAPKLTLAAGVEYWNRVHNYVIPYGGVVWTPNNHWEFRLLFPNSRVSYYLGNLHSYDIWAYGSAEFQIEAYQIDTAAGVRERGQWQDYEVFFGFDAGKGRLSAFLQAGAILDRRVRFSGPTPDFSLGNQFIVRTGLMF